VAPQLRALTLCCTATGFGGCALALLRDLLDTRQQPASALEEITLVGAGNERYPPRDELAWCAQCLRPLAAALRAAATLRALHLQALWNGVESAPALRTLLPALVGHPSLSTLTLRDNVIGGNEAAQEAAGALFADVLAADAPALTALDVSWCNLGAAGLRRLAAALAANTHLRALKCAGNIGGGLVPFGEEYWHGGGARDGNNGNAFRTERDIMLPAVRAHASLRTLDSMASWPCEAAPLPRARAGADADAAASDEAPALSAEARALVARRRDAYLRGGVSLEQLGFWYHA
jgi:hypothetical protein